MALECEECKRYRASVAFSRSLNMFVCDECFTDINDAIEDIEREIKNECS